MRTDLKRQGFVGQRVRIERMLNMRFDGTDTALMVLPTADDGNESGEGEDFLTAFRKTYKNEFGFLLDTKNIIVDDIKVLKQFPLSLRAPLVTSNAHGHHFPRFAESARLSTRSALLFLRN